MASKKNVMSMIDEDKAFFEAAMKNPEIKKKIEADMKKRDELFGDKTKKTSKKRSK